MTKRIKSPPSSDGEAAVLRVIHTLAGRFLERPGNSWSLWLERSGDQPGFSSLRGMPDMERAQKAVSALAAGVADAADLWLVPEVTCDGPATVDGRVPSHRAVLAIGIRMELDRLYEPGGPLHAELGLVPVEAPIKLHVGHWRRARAFALEHLDGACFRPGLVIQRGWSLDLFFIFEHALMIESGSQDWQARLGPLLCGFLHTAHPLGHKRPVTLGGLLGGGGAERASPTRLLVARADRLITPRRVEETAQELKELRRRLAPLARGAAGGDLPPAMSLRTLSPKWHLEDWSLSARHKQLIGTGSDDAGVMLFGQLPEIVAECARRRHGWLDVEALLDDPRFRFDSAAELRGTTRGGLKRAFRQALDEIDLRFPPRLPFGVRQLVPIEPAQPGEGRRYVLAGRSANRPFRVEVSWGVLASPVRMRRALEAEFEALLPPIPPKTWDAMLQVGLTDPRCRRRGGAQSTRALSDRIQQFVNRAQPYLPPRRDLTSSDPHGWPLIRDGVAVFPRGILISYLANEGGSRRNFGRKEITEAITSLGGGPRDVMHFSESGKIRVWFCPMTHSNPASNRPSTSFV